MSDSRERYLAWLAYKCLRDSYDRWETWQAAEAQAVRLCAELCKYGASAADVEIAIRAEFPEVWE